MQEKTPQHIKVTKMTKNDSNDNVHSEEYTENKEVVLVRCIKAKEKYTSTFTFTSGR